MLKDNARGWRQQNQVYGTLVRMLLTVRRRTPRNVFHIVRASIISHDEKSRGRVDSGLSNFISFNSQDNFMGEVHCTPMKKSTLWEVKLHVQSHTANKW